MFGKNQKTTQQLDAQHLHDESRLRQLAMCWTLDRKLANELLRNMQLECRPDVSLNRKLKWTCYCSCLFGLWQSRFGFSSAVSDPVIYELTVTGLIKKLALLTVEQRVALTLIDIAELSYHETGTILDINDQQVRRSILAARNALLVSLREESANNQ